MERALDSPLLSRLSVTRHSGHAGRVVVSNPLRTRAIADAKTKTDTIDASTLAELLAADYLPTVWQPDPATRVLRRRVAARVALVAERTRFRNRIQAVLMRNLVACPWSDTFGAGGHTWLSKIELPADEREQGPRGWVRLPTCELSAASLRLLAWPEDAGRVSSARRCQPGGA